LREQHLRTAGELRSRILAVEVTDGGHARIRACMRSSAVAIGASGAVHSRDPATARITMVMAERTTSGWRVSDWFTGGDLACEL
jgi:hypothetical protein